MVEPGDIDALSQALRRLLGDASLRKQMGAAGRERAERIFDAEVIVGQVRQLWADVLAEQEG